MQLTFDGRTWIRGLKLDRSSIVLSFSGQAVVLARYFCGLNGGFDVMNTIRRGGEMLETMPHDGHESLSVRKGLSRSIIIQKSVEEVERSISFRLHGCCRSSTRFSLSSSLSLKPPPIILLPELSIPTNRCIELFGARLTSGSAAGDITSRRKELSK
jgi:hypothetical protein